MRSLIALSAVALLAASASAHVVEHETLVQAYSDEKEDNGNNMLLAEEEFIDHDYLNTLVQDHSHEEHHTHNDDDIDHDEVDELVKDPEEVDHDEVDELDLVRGQALVGLLDIGVRDGHRDVGCFRRGQARSDA